MKMQTVQVDRKGYYAMQDQKYHKDTFKSDLVLENIQTHGGGLLMCLGASSVKVKNCSAKGSFRGGWLANFTNPLNYLEIDNTGIPDIIGPSEGETCIRLMHVLKARIRGLKLDNTANKFGKECLQLRGRGSDEENSILIEDSTFVKSISLGWMKWEYQIPPVGLLQNVTFRRCKIWGYVQGLPGISKIRFEDCDFYRHPDCNFFVSAEKAFNGRPKAEIFLDGCSEVPIMGNVKVSNTRKANK